MLRRVAQAACLAVCLLAACADTGPELSPLSPQAVILAFGDSLTRGSGAREDQSYPAVLAALSGHDVINAGIPGELSAAGLARIDAVLDKVKPQLLILCHGGNDLLRKQDLKQTAANLTAMITRSRARGVEVLLLGVPKPGLWLRTAEIYPTVASATTTPLVSDSIARILADGTLKSDPVHPNAAGYRKLAEDVHAALTALGAL